jgi:hypothetical protein
MIGPSIWLVPGMTCHAPPDSCAEPGDPDAESSRRRSSEKAISSVVQIWTAFSSRERSSRNRVPMWAFVKRARGTHLHD